MGAIPITNPYAALETNVQHGIVIQGRPYRDMLCNSRYAGEIVRLARQPALQEEIRREMMPWAREKFDWERMVDQWCEWIEDKPEPKFFDTLDQIDEVLANANSE